MDDSISRQAAINEIKEPMMLEYVWAYSCKEEEEAISVLVETICQQTKSTIADRLERLKSADVVEVVRCKDCIWFEPDSVWEKGKKIRYRKKGEFVSAEEGVNVQSYCECPRYRHLDGLMFVTEEHYCAHGERRENE